MTNCTVHRVSEKRFVISHLVQLSGSKMINGSVSSTHDSKVLGRTNDDFVRNERTELYSESTSTNFKTHDRKSLKMLTGAKWSPRLSLFSRSNVKHLRCKLHDPERTQASISKEKAALMHARERINQLISGVRYVFNFRSL